jgi:hypothetical protein
MVLAAGVDIVFESNVEVAFGTFFRILIAAPTAHGMSFRILR